MKNLKLYIKESLLDDEDVLMKDTGDEAIKNEILKFLKDNYTNGTKCIISKKPINGKYVVDCLVSLEVENRNIISLTNEYFEFGVVEGHFICDDCNSLTSLKGAPKEVGWNFDCTFCNSLTSLEGAPKEVDGNFYCSYCDSLTSLEGAPKEVDENFYCFHCKSLKSLKGAPKKVGWNFNCAHCISLTSLKGAPKEVVRNFDCRDCKTKFTEEDVRNVSNVKKGEIFC